MIDYHVSDVPGFRLTLGKITRFGRSIQQIFCIMYFWDIGIPGGFVVLVIWYPQQIWLLLFCTLPNALNMLLALNTSMLLICAQLHHFNAYVRLLCFRLNEMQSFVRLLLRSHYYPKMWLHQWNEAMRIDSIDSDTPATNKKSSDSNESNANKHRPSIVSLNQPTDIGTSTDQIFSSKACSASPDPMKMCSQKMMRRLVNIRQQELVSRTLQQLHALAHEMFLSRSFFNTVLGWTYMTVFFTVVLLFTIFIFDNLLPIWRRGFTLLASFTLLFISQVLPCYINMRLISNVRR